MVAVRNAVETVTGGRSKTQPACQLFTVNIVRSARQRAATQRAHVQTLQRILQTAFVTGQHLHVRQAPVRKGHRLSALKMGIPRHHRILIIRGSLHQRALQLAGGVQQLTNGHLAPQLQIGGDLIVTATPGVKFLTQLTYFVDQLAFHPAVNIFGIAFENALRVRLHLFKQRLQRLLKLYLLIGRQNAYGHQRFRPGDRAHNILLRQAIIESQRVVELFKPLIRCLSKTPTPKCHIHAP